MSEGYSLTDLNVGVGGGGLFVVVFFSGDVCGTCLDPSLTVQTPARRQIDSTHSEVSCKPGRILCSYILSADVLILYFL